MKSTLRVEVTAADIASAERRDAWECPIAKAIGRLFGEDGYADTSEISCGNESYVPSLRAIRFMNEWDSGLAVAPTKFRFQRFP